MNKQQLTKLLRDPSLSEESLYDLHELQATYPYCQPVHVLVALANKQANTERSKQTMGYAAMHVVDRGNLKQNFNTYVNVDQKKPAAKKPPVQKKPVQTPPQEKPASQQKVTQRPKPATKKEIKIEKKEPITSSLKPSSSDGLRTEFLHALDHMLESKKKYNDILDHESEVPVKATPVAPKKQVTKKKPEKKPVKAKKSAPKTKAQSKSTSGKETKKKTTKTAAATKKTTKKPRATTIQKTDKTEKKTKPESVKSEKDKIKEQQELISKFIEVSPSIKAKAANPPAVDPDQKDLSVPSTSFSENLASENLAEIMIGQGKIDKAIDIYKKLIWKYPQKKAYFAARIEELKK